jgi:hypothetical protein
MSDQRNHKDPLEQFFEKKAAEFDIPFREDDWNRMAGMLDLRDARSAYRRRVLWIAAASLLAVSVLGYFTFENYSRINQLARLLEDDKVEVATPVPPGNDTAGQGSLNPSTGDPDAGRITQRMNDPAPDLTDEQVHVADEGDDGIAADAITPNTLPDVHEMLTSDGVETALDGNKVDAAIALNHVPMIKKPGMDTVRLDPAIFSTSAVAVQQQAGLGRGHKETMLSRFSATLQLSPDMSTAGSVTNFSSPGYKTGITVQYRISPRWSVSTGLIRSEVRYSARGRDYDPPVYWPSGGGPEHISAVCLLVDIPVTLRYDVLQFSGSRFYATAGLSSYIMLNEEYNFRYDGYVYGQPESWNGRTGTRHWLSNAGFSVGYELDIHPNWSLQAEPFIALPLREVGWGNVRLYSVGSYLSVRYRFGP